jgi:hypothetical protein
MKIQSGAHHLAKETRSLLCPHPKERICVSLIQMQTPLTVLIISMAIPLLVRITISLLEVIMQLTKRYRIIIRIHIPITRTLMDHFMVIITQKKDAMKVSHLVDV